jgi:site-specific DNA-methyltransferase (adenine-specific)
MKTLPRNTVLTGNARDVLADLLPESVDCCVTSPPYVNGLRDYGAPGQLGQEPTVTEYVANLRDVLRLVRAVLKPTGSLWLNLGDSFSKHPRQGAPRGGLLLAPQRVALTLSDMGFVLRNVVVWQKPAPMPESARDRLSRTHEVVILAAKTRRIFFDLDSIRVPHRSAARARRSPKERGRLYQGGNDGLGKLKAEGRVGHRNGKNPGDCWVVPTATDLRGHQATFPEQLIEPMILSTCPERICVQCDSAWTRPTRIVSRKTNEGMRHTREVGELRRCDCRAPVRAGVALDCFAGTGTTLAVAERLNRDWLGVELNPRYAELAELRLAEQRKSRGGGRTPRRAEGSALLSARRKSYPLTKGGDLG